MLRTFKYRLHPNAHQEQVLDVWLKQCCTLYNAALEQRITWWKSQRKNITRYDQQVQLTELRTADPMWEITPVIAQRSALRRVELAYAAFFRRCKKGETPGFPRFRSHKRYDSFAIGAVKASKDRVHIPKLGHVKFNLYRPIAGIIKNAIVRRDAKGWWINFQCDLGDALIKADPLTAVGIDLGLTHFATLSTGETIDNPRFAKRAASKLAKRQHKLSRKQKGSKNRERAKILVAKAHAHVANQRLDHARKQAKVLYARFDEVVHEDLNIKGLAGSRLAKSVNDASWGIFLRCLASKAEEAGKHCTAVDPRGTSQRCSGCRTIVKKILADRVHACPVCGLVLDRDHNAAINTVNARPARSGASVVLTSGEREASL